MIRLARRLLGLGLLVFAFLGSPASAAPTYRGAAVSRAFATVKIKLARTPSGNESQSVTALTAVVPTRISHKPPFALAVWVYDTADVATQAFKSGEPQWRANGIASMQVRNLVVIAVPKGREIGTQGPAFAMPLLVRRALSALKHGA
jgi:hypothetical protein